MDTSVYTTPPEELTEDELEFLDVCTTTILSGDRLYGEDEQHVLWVVMNVLHILEGHAQEEGTAATYIEITYQKDMGYGIAIINPTADTLPDDTLQ